MKIYTKTGDKGQTGLPGGERVLKDAAVTEVCGTVDEMNTAIGMARAAGVPGDVDALLDQIQSKLFDLGAEAAGRGTASNCTQRITAAASQTLEASDRPLRRRTAAAAELHFAGRHRVRGLAALRPRRLPPGGAAFSHAPARVPGAFAGNPGIPQPPERLTLRAGEAGQYARGGADQKQSGRAARSLLPEGTTRTVKRSGMPFLNRPV